MDNFTMQAAAALLVDAYKQVTAEYLSKMPKLDIRTSDDNFAAPEDYETLCDDFAVGLLVISTNHSATSIYGAAGNVAFRTMHDLGHIAHGLTFSLADEVSLAMVQWPMIRKHIHKTEFREVCRDLYMADTVAMSLYNERFGEFPCDQTEFVQRCCAEQ